jgi:hypothetical protein
MKRSTPALVLLAAGIALALWTWARWGDVQVDWGREVYLAWRVSQGDVLYRDVAYYAGPLSPWINALWFKLFGAGIWTLYLANLALVALDTALVYALVRRLADSFTATLGGLLFLALFAFGRFQFLDDYNFVAPYCHEIVHATPLCLGCLLALQRRPALAGGLFGLVLLTKPEFALALGAAAFAGLLLGRAGWRAWGGFAGAALLAPLCAWSAGADVLGGWRYVFDGRITRMLFYRRVMGTDAAADNLVRLLEIGAAEALLCAGCWACARRLPGTAARAAWSAGAALGAALLWLLPLEPADWLELARPWPLFALAGFGFFLRRRAQPLAAAFALFALVLLAKMPLDTRLQMYGFGLALPATLLVCLLVVETAPRLVAARGGSFVLARALGCGALLAFALGHLRVMASWQARPSVAVGVGRDAFRSDSRGTVVGATLRELQQKLQPGESFAVLPEGAMLNYLARVPAPSRYVYFMPPELLMFGEERMLAELRAARPAAVVLLHKDTSEYGFPWFGRDYGRGFGAWLASDYAPGALFGDEPLRAGSRYGARVLWRKDLGAR